jgi:hypothetical protein
VTRPILVTNHAAAREVLGRFSIVEADVRDAGAPLFEPAIP